MKKLFVLSVIVLTGLLVACSSGNEPNIRPNVDPDIDTDIDTSALEEAIQEAKDERFGVLENTDASDVPTGLFWVTEAEMDTLNAAIEDAEAVMDNPSSQDSVDAAEASLKAAIETFKAAKKAGTAPAITLSGTITIKNNGQPVPYVRIYAHTIAWSWSGSTRLFASSGEDVPWSIIIKPFSGPTQIFLRVQCWTDDNYGSLLFQTDVKDLMVEVYNTDVSNIVIDLANFKTITLSGTISGSYEGKPVPSMAIQAQSKSDYLVLGETSIQQVGNNIPWSMVIESSDTDTEIMFSLFGFNGPSPWVDEELFSITRLSPVTVKDQDVSDIEITLNPITLSGTINGSYDGKPIPYVRIWVLEPFENGGWYSDKNFTVQQAGNNTPWSITMAGFDRDTDITLRVMGSIDGYFGGGDLLFDRWEDPITVKDQDVSGININLPTYIILSGTLNVPYGSQPIPDVFITTSTYNDDFGVYMPGAAASLTQVVNNTPWSITMEAFDKDTEVRLSIYHGSSQLDGPTITVKDQSVSDINIVLPTFIALSGTINVTIDGKPVPYVIMYFSADGRWGGITIQQAGNNTPWSIVMEGFNKDTEVELSIYGYDENDEGVFYYMFDNPITVKDKSISNIVLEGNYNSELDEWE
jgi:hypothetical protein